MEEKLSIKLLNTKNALKSLETSIRFYNIELDKLALTDNLELKKITRDSIIQRFEYSVELSWKLVYEFIKQKHQLDLPASPKAVFKECLKIKLLSEEDIEQSVEMVNLRNLTAHVYQEAIANQMVDNVPQYLKLLKKIINQVEQNV